jgi:hypothetical protein
MKTLLLAAALLCGVSGYAHAGQWVGSGNESRAKAACRSILTHSGDMVRWDKCMNKHGLVWVDQPETETPVASDDDARVHELENQNEQLRIAIQNEQLRALGQSMGQALINTGNSMNQPPVHCHPHTLQLGC